MKKNKDLMLKELKNMKKNGKIDKIPKNLFNKQKLLCKHQISIKLAILLDEFERIEVNEEEFSEKMCKIKFF